jgi:hypothetical protein
VRFEGQQENLPRPRTYSGRSSSGSSGRRRRGNRQRKFDAEQRQNEPRPVRSKGHHGKPPPHPQPSTSAQALAHAKHKAEMLNKQKGYENSDSSSLCSTCSSSSSETEDMAYQLPQRRSYGGVRVNYVPNDALALARYQMQLQQRKNAQQNNQSASSEKDAKNCIIS